MTQEPDTGNGDLAAEALVGRIVDGEATPADCAEFERLADAEDEIIRDTLIAREGQIVNEQVREALGLGELPKTYHTRPPIELE